MNINRKIQLAASVVIANGALALGLLSSGSALAATCLPKSFCVTQSQCVLPMSLTFCRATVPPGCSLAGAGCAGQGQGCGDAYKVICYYK
jgi:hypothetical protein